VHAKTTLAEVFHSSLATAPENLFAGAKLTWESVVDVGASSSSIPGNGARKLIDGAMMMLPENLLACSK
jgi:hypothetical protein